jgi:hypothetical protein
MRTLKGSGSLNYRKRQEEEVELPPLRGCAVSVLLLVGVVALLIWWVW